MSRFGFRGLLAKAARFLFGWQWTKHVGFAVLFCLAPAPLTAALPAPDFAAARDEAVKILSGFIQVDTSNPPGNETQGAEYLKRILDREGIASEILALEPARGNLVARLKGNGRKKPLLLMGHIDVVGVERSKWTMDPFGGVIKRRLHLRPRRGG